MSPRVALFLLAGLCIAEVLLRISEQIDRAVAWICPCDSPHP